MADLSLTPVATQIKPMPTMSLGEMVNIARGAQAYQTGEIGLRLEQQKEIERQRLQEFLARPENYQTQGRVDINKLNAEVPKIAPLTGADWMQKYTTLGNAQTQAIQAAQNLTQTQREMIASRLAIMGRLGVNDKRAYLAELDQLVKENPNNPDLSRLVESYKTTMGVLPDNANLPQLAISGANSLLNPQTQQQLFAPQAGTASTGAATFPTVTQPSVAGEAPRVTVGQTPLVTAQLPPGSREVPTGQYDLNNMPIFNVFDANGRFVGQRSGSGTPTAGQLPGAQVPTPTGGMVPPPGMQPPGMQPPGMQPPGMQPGGVQTFPVQPQPQIQGQPLPPPGMAAPAAPAMTAPGGPQPVARLRPGETPETYKAAQQIRMSSADAAAQVPMQTFNNNQIIKLADDVITGKGAGLLANLTGGYAGIPWTSDNATNLNQLGHYMALQTASLAQSAGLGTDAARGIAGQMAGSTNWTAPAIKQTARVNRALSTGTDLFNRGVQNAFTASKGDAFSARDFQNKWSQTVDVNALRLYDAIRNNDKQGIQEVVNQVGGPKSTGYTNLKNKITEMQRLVGGQ